MQGGTADGGGECLPRLVRLYFLDLTQSEFPRLAKDARRGHPGFLLVQFGWFHARRRGHQRRTLRRYSS